MDRAAARWRVPVHAAARKLVEHAVFPNAVPMMLVAVSVLLVAAVGLFAGFQVKVRLYSVAFLVLGPPLLLVISLGACLWVLWRDRPQRPTRHLLHKFGKDWRAGERLLRGVPILFVFPLFFGAFTSYKSTLGKLVPFHFDDEARLIDAFLHGGDPWLLLHPVLGHPQVTAVINFLYNLWFVLLYFILAIVAFVVSDQRLRAQYLVAFILCWALIGMVGATVFASVGPCFYAYFHGGDAYAHIQAYLREVAQQYPVPALHIQDMLLTSFRENSPGVGTGISALPSMHVSMAALNALFLASYGRLAGAVGWVFCFVTFLGSVHLGWHYAIDGYVALALTILVWKLSRWMVSGRLGPLHLWQAGR